MNNLIENSYAAYLYGSRVYGTAGLDSDWDYIIVNDFAGEGEMSHGNVDYKCMSREKFQQLIYIHNISALECLFLPDEMIAVEPEIPWVFNLDLKALRSSVSKKSSHSWVKAKKKFMSPYELADKEIYRGKKSLFHAIRILDFGIQIANHKRIINYSSCNDIYEDIMTEPSNDWNVFSDKWKPVYNELASNFKLLAPK